jgi:hypothetical protein
MGLREKIVQGTIPLAGAAGGRNNKYVIKDHRARCDSPDVVLIHSDDARAFAALEVIGDLAERTQVLFFTHHRRLAELGMKAGAQLIELDTRRQQSLEPT